MVGAASSSQATQVITYTCRSDDADASLCELDNSTLMGSHSFFLYAGIGKSLFIYYLMWKLALSGKTIIWDRRGIMPVMFSSQGVFKGPLEAFESNLQDPETWYACTLFSSS